LGSFHQTRPDRAIQLFYEVFSEDIVQKCFVKKIEFIQCYYTGMTISQNTMIIEALLFKGQWFFVLTNQNGSYKKQ